jgi:hypothetical protein
LLTPREFVPLGNIGSEDWSKAGPRAILKMGPGDYRMWYCSYYGYQEGSISYATSSDGLLWDKQGVVLTASYDWEGGTNGLIFPTAVLFEAGAFKMWYTAFQPGPRQLRVFGYAASPDGLSWTKHPVPVLDVGVAGSWDDAYVAQPSVIHVGPEYRMYYQAGSIATGKRQYGLATSSDGISWTRWPGNPIYTHPGTVALDPSGLLFFWGSSTNDLAGPIQFAWSQDGVSFVEGPTNPVLTPDPNAYDSVLDGDYFVYRDGPVYRLSFSGIHTRDSARGIFPEYSLMAEVNASVADPNQPPTVNTAPTAKSVTATSATLSVLGADDGGETNLSYTWGTLYQPTGASPVLFAPNRTNAAKTTIATFAKPGTYVLRVVIGDAGDRHVAADVTLDVGSFDKTPPAFTALPAATPNPTSQDTTLLSVQGADDTSLTYYWTLDYNNPIPPANVVFSDNDSSTARITTVTLPLPGSYTFKVFLIDAGGQTAYSTITVVRQ